MHHLRTFRLFVSSTFADFKVERQILQERVFPRIDEHCKKKGFQFHPIDLRWGINAEAQANQKTLELCLNEVRSCKQYPYPNFIILNGNRYGWIPLPDAIDKIEFDKIISFIAQTHDKKQIEALKYLEYWYVEDKNHLSNKLDNHAYILRRRDNTAYNDILTGQLFSKDFISLNDEKQESNIHWTLHESILRNALQYAIGHLFTRGEVTENQRNKYFVSATESEVLEGVFQYVKLAKNQQDLIDSTKDNNSSNLDCGYVYAFNRNINKIEGISHSESQSEVTSSSFVDENIDDSTSFNQRLKQAIPPVNWLSSTIDFAEINSADLSNKHYLLEFEHFMVKKLTEAVNQHINDVKNIDSLSQERDRQARFKSTFTDSFVGRTAELAKIATYIEGSSEQPLIINGTAGQGKTALIAKAASEAEKCSSYITCYKFIGVSSTSSHTRRMLESLIQDLALNNCLQVPEQYETENDNFYSQIQTLLKQISIPTIIFIDGLDKLHNENFLQWLPIQLPKTLKVVISLMTTNRITHYSALLSSKIDDNNHINLTAFYVEEALSCLKLWLKTIQRTLSKEQSEYVIKVFAKSDGSPLYLRFIFEEVRHWQSNHWQLNLPNNLFTAIDWFRENLTSKHYHNHNVVKYIIGLIISSKSGLTEKEIIDLLSDNSFLLDEIEGFNSLEVIIEGVSARRFPTSVWLRIFEQIRPFLHEYESNGHLLLTLSNEAITETLKQKVYDGDKLAIHSALIKYFTSNQTERSYVELPWNLFKINNNEGLADFLSSIDNYLAFVKSNQQEDIIVYLNYLAKDDVFFIKIVEKYKQLNEVIPDVYNLITTLLLNSNKSNILQSFLSYGEQLFNDNPEMLSGIYQKYAIGLTGYQRMPYMEKSLEQALKVKEINPSKLAKIYNSIGISARGSVFFKLAESSFQKSLREYNKDNTAGINKFYSLDVLINLANLYIDWDDDYYHDLAKQYSIYSLEQVELLSISPHFLVTIYNNLAVTFKRLCLLKESENCYIKSINCHKEHSLNNKFSFPSTFFNLSMLYIKTTQLNLASICIVETLKSLNSSYQILTSPVKQGRIIDLSNQVRDLIDNVGDERFEANDILTIYTELLNLVSKFPHNEEDVANISYNIGVHYTQIKELGMSLKYFNLAYDASRTYFGEYHPSTIENLKAIYMIRDSLATTGSI
ncbi:DUF4062 domain-containing protein [Shewanella electrodiphila]|uniref:DUF4062 domain-containing protein n=1 Tax=Shewanella electrodiphila TaxID=934143 RepID=A0ABT0KU20_9GAMM|nr:DUF4062 domain-containing protein [Shewanella electrodiphila]MCL1046850.1 DUF4062 domain-containing protein [Shewanella electrodiphila]